MNYSIFYMLRTIKLLNKGVLVVISYDENAYLSMLDKIEDRFMNAASCMSQCTGCKCSCKCSCKNREDETFEWEEF